MTLVLLEGEGYAHVRAPGATRRDLVSPTWTKTDRHLSSSRAPGHRSFRQNTCFLALSPGSHPTPWRNNESLLKQH